MSKQTAYLHLKSPGVNPQESSNITWEILHHNVRSYNERKIIEAIEMHNSSQHLMNGCVDRDICV